jgi:hypothetical protein
VVSALDPRDDHFPPAVEAGTGADRVGRRLPGLGPEQHRRDQVDRFDPVAAGDRAVGLQGEGDVGDRHHGEAQEQEGQGPARPPAGEGDDADD